MHYPIPYRRDGKFAALLFLHHDLLVGAMAVGSLSYLPVQFIELVLDIILKFIYSAGRPLAAAKRTPGAI